MTESAPKEIIKVRRLDRYKNDEQRTAGEKIRQRIKLGLSPSRRDSVTREPVSIASAEDFARLS